MCRTCQTLQESLLPPSLLEIPGLNVAARYAAGGTGAEVLGDFYDVFPSVRGSWGIAVGDVCGKGAPAAKSTALARYTLRAEAHRESRPSVILAALNQALLDWLTDDPRFLTAIYATVRPTAGGASVHISSGGHPLAPGPGTPSSPTRSTPCSRQPPPCRARPLQTRLRERNGPQGRRAAPAAVSMTVSR
jgi:serine phosphatase RsbU (regulator of sigma subunit)